MFRRGALKHGRPAGREEARDFRLISSALSCEHHVRTRAEEEEKLSQGSIETIHAQLLPTVDLLRRSMGLQTCALLWLDSSGDKLKFKELWSESTHIAEGPLSAHTGALAAIIKDRRPCLLESPRPSLLPYYQGPADVAAFWGVPVFEGLSLRGVLLGDRKAGAAFSASEVESPEGKGDATTLLSLPCSGGICYCDAPDSAGRLVVDANLLSTLSVGQNGEIKLARLTISTVASGNATIDLVGAVIQAGPFAVE